MTPSLESWRGGVIPAVPVPFRADGGVDSQALDTYATWMSHQRVPAVAVGVHTGRGLHLEDVQRAHVVAAWKERGHRLVLGVGASAGRELPTGPRERTDAVVRETVAMAQWARTEGAEAVLVYPPASLRELADVAGRCVALHEAVAAVGVPTIVFYLYDAAGGIDYPDSALDEMLGIENIVGVKLATLDRRARFSEVAALISRHDGKLCITGEDLFLGDSLAAGADAALIGMAAACTDRMTELFDMHRANNSERFAALSAAIDEFARVAFGEPVDGYVQRMLWALECDGVLAEAAHDPFGPVLALGDRTRVCQAVSMLRAA